MLRTMIRLPDGSEVFSGVEPGNVIRNVKLTECVNNAKELTLGSVCAKMLEAELLTPNGGLELTAGEAVSVYKIDDAENAHLVGQFLLEEPERVSANALRITAYDRISKLDKDMTEWLAGLNGWPYSLLKFAQMVCSACGLTLANSSIPNGSYQVKAFTATNITGRKLMQWVGEIAGRFCHATAEGKIEFAWYAPSGVALTPDGARFYYQNSLAYENYAVAPVEKVQIKLTQDDVGVFWPDVTGEKNTYVICGNYLLTTNSTAAILPVAKTLYAQLEAVTYTPCKVQIPAGLDIHAGHTVQITDKNGKTVTAYVMTKTQEGQLDVLECTGSHRRDSTTAVNNEKYEALARQTLEIQKAVEGLTVTATKLQTDIQQVDEGLTGAKTQIQSIKTSVSELEADAEGIRASVSNTQSTIAGVDDDLQATKTELASVKLTSGELRVEIQQVDSAVTDQQKQIQTIDESVSKLEADTESIRASVSSTQSTIAGVDDDLQATKTELASVKLTSSELRVEIQQVDGAVTNHQKRIQSINESIRELVADTEGIRASVSDTQSNIDGVADDLQATKTELASMKLTSSDLQVQIRKINDDGVRKVTTTTGTFDEAGLTIDKSNSPTKTQVTPDGMVVYKKAYGGGTSEVLSATSGGVNATNLHAKTYLIIGGRSRFENYGTNRTGCFWIGG